jgi:trimeric autotransporter adhesin
MNRSTRSALICLTMVTALFLPAVCEAQTYTITTAAGGANPYFTSGSGDAGPATSAALGNPCYDTAVDAAGNLYIASGGLIRKVSVTGVISTFAGGGSSIGDGVPATTAALSPVAIAVDGAGNLYIAETVYGMSLVRKVNTSGIITTIAGGAACCALGDGGPATAAYLAVPYGLAVDSGGNLYIAQVNGNDNLIRKVSSNGFISTVAGGGAAGNIGDGGPATGAGLSRPLGVAVDSSANLYLAESAGNRIRKVDQSGIISTLAAANSPWHVAADSAGNAFVTQINDAAVQMVTPGGTVSTIAGNGSHGFSGDGGPGTSASLDRPAGISVSASGQVYVADDSLGIDRVRVLTPPPVIAQGGIVPLYSTAASIQPGSWVSIYGSHLAGAPTVWNGNFPVSLAGTSVTINSKPAYLWFVSPGQINLQAPDDSTSGVVNVTVTTNGGTASSTVTLSQYGPSFNLIGGKYAAAIVPTGNSPGNSGAGYDVIGPAGTLPFPSRPVKAGETLLLYGVGFGPTNPAVSAGKVFSGAANSITPPRITIGGVAATVTFAGIIQAGLFQFNIIVPNAGSGDQVLQATVGGTTTPNNVFITLQ